MVTVFSLLVERRFFSRTMAGFLTTIEKTFSWLMIFRLRGYKIKQFRKFEKSIQIQNCLNPLDLILESDYAKKINRNLQLDMGYGDEVHIQQDIDEVTNLRAQCACTIHGCAHVPFPLNEHYGATTSWKFFGIKFITYSFDPYGAIQWINCDFYKRGWRPINGYIKREATSGATSKVICLFWECLHRKGFRRWFSPYEQLWVLYTNKKDVISWCWRCLNKM